MAKAAVRGIILTVAILAVSAALAALYFLYDRPAADPLASVAGSGIMKIQSPQFEQNGPIPVIFTCDGDDISPPLVISGAPEDARSLALVVDDPDAAAGPWIHWVLWNISPETTEIAAGQTPRNAIAGTTSFGRLGYGGPCPPTGQHRYFFKLYALDVVLGLPPTAKAVDLEAAMSGHVLDKAGLLGTYGR